MSLWGNYDSWRAGYPEEIGPAREQEPERRNQRFVDAEEAAHLRARLARTEEKLRLANEEIGALKWKLKEAEKR